jgi:hypothetical protein
MRSSFRIALVLSALVLSARPATAQETAPPTTVSGFHAGANLSIHQPLVTDETDLIPELEAGVLIKGIVDLYLDLGLDVERESFDDDDRQVTSTAGGLMPEVGARFIIGAPRPGSAFFYAGLAVTPVIGIASYTSDGDDADDAYYEERAREYMDRFDIGVLVGVEYLVAASFGIGAEAGFVTSINNLKETDREEPDEHLEVGFFVPFSIRAAYHF